jgi:ornithine cyclodeaminase
MLVLNSEKIRRLVSMPRLIECLERAFRCEYRVPSRQIAEIPGGEGRLLLSMSAFDIQGAGVVKLATVMPDNPSKGVPTIQSAIVVFSETGAPMALLDGAIVTKLRTGAASALASTYLSRSDSTHLVVIGTGALAPFMAMAHASARPIRRISICGRHPERTAATANEVRALVSHDIEVLVPSSIEAAVGTADIVSCATSSATPVLAGTWLRPGTFVDLVGSFSASKREADDDVIRRSRIFVDTIDGALSEAGDLLDPLLRAVITRERIEGELGDLVCGRVIGRTSDDDITLFKAVGSAIEDLATAQMIITAADREPPGG